MSSFYGTLVGRRGASVTKQGDNASGIRAAAQSYKGSVIVEMHYGKDDELQVEVCCRDGSESSIRGESWEGSFDEFRKLLRRSACRRK